MGLLAESVAWRGLSGAGYSILFLGGLALINGAVPSEHRGGMLSALYLFAYLSLGVVALVLGAIAEGSASRSTSAPASSPYLASPQSACSRC
jgi:hypothetical protein